VILAGPGPTRAGKPLLVNTRIRKRCVRAMRKSLWYRAGKGRPDLNPVEWLGDDMGLLAKLPNAVKDALVGTGRKSPRLILVRRRLSIDGVHARPLETRETVQAGADDWNGQCPALSVASRTGWLMLGYAMTAGSGDAAKSRNLLLRLVADEMNYEPFKDSFKVFIGHHGDGVLMRRT